MANFAAFFLNLIGVRFFLTSGSSIDCRTFNSIGNPCVSQPGTYRTRFPLSAWYRVMKSFRILFKACPMCKSPFAYGGPSCNVNDSRFSFDSSRFATCLYTLFSSHHFCMSGSFCTEFARISNVVCGSKTVAAYAFDSFFFPELLFFLLFVFLPPFFFGVFASTEK